MTSLFDRFVWEGVAADPAGTRKGSQLEKEEEKMKKSAALLGFIIGLFFVISGWGLVPHLYAAPIEIKVAQVIPRISIPPRRRQAPRSSSK